MIKKELLLVFVLSTFFVGKNTQKQIDLSYTMILVR